MVIIIVWEETIFILIINNANKTIIRMIIIWEATIFIIIMRDNKANMIIITIW